MPPSPLSPGVITCFEETKRTLVRTFSDTVELDLEQLREQLLAVVEETMQPAHLSLWIRPLKQQTSGEDLPHIQGSRTRAARSDLG